MMNKLHDRSRDERTKERTNFAVQFESDRRARMCVGVAISSMRLHFTRDEQKVAIRKAKGPTVKGDDILFK